MINKNILFDGSILSVKRTMTAKAAKNIAVSVRGFLTAVKNTPCEIKKNEARNAYGLPMYLFDVRYTASGAKEHIDT